MSKNNLNSILIIRLTSLVIILSTLLLTLETIYHDNGELLNVFKVIDYFILTFFTIEIVFRFFKFEYSLKEIINALKAISFSVYKGSSVPEKSRDCLNDLFWFTFDLTILVLSIISLFFISIFKHPEILSMFRVIRIFRIVRIFEINKTLRDIEKKIISVLPTVFIFGSLLFIILFIFALIGSNIYNFKKYENINFSSIYEAIISLFSCLTNGWENVHFELRQTNVNHFITDFYLISFFVSCSMITLNLFLSVLISQIQEKLIKKVDKQNSSDTQKIEKLNDSIEVLLEKITSIENRLNK